MNMQQCAGGGHFYDASIHSECPYCKTDNVGATMPLDMGHTMPLAGGSSDIGKTMPLAPGGDGDNRTRAQGSVNDAGRTVAIIKEELGIDPVVGWLISLEGKEKGRDYRIHTDNNYIGRGENMDICIRGDDTISRENHATISYDSRDKVFYFTPGDGRSIVRLNDKGVFSTAELNAYDILEIGKTKLVFMPLCGDRFEWE
ncbi:MAG: FHA domain-containing protein [Oscillospiraceae bacterium]|nr:FHA domain-containing protein [Oscillospiraceae bacterium]